MEAQPTIERGDLYRVTFRGANRELTGSHYAVVVSDEPYHYLSTVVVVPFSSHARPASFRPETTLGGSRTRALVDQVSAVDMRLLRERTGSLAGTGVMAAIDEQLRLFLALD